MTPAELATYVRFKTRTNATTFTDAQILALLKPRADEISRKLLDADEDIFCEPDFASLVGTPVSQREYAEPSDLLARIKRVETKLDGTNWVKLKEMDLVDYDFTTDEDSILGHFSNSEGEAKFDIARKSIWIYSGVISDVTDGLKFWLNTYPAEILDLTSTTDMSIDPSATTHGIPREVHELLARGIVIDYKESREKPIPLTQSELSYKTDLQAAIETLRHGNSDREIFASLPLASERWNNGQDL